MNCEKKKSENLLQLNLITIHICDISLYQRELHIFCPFLTPYEIFQNFVIPYSPYLAHSALSFIKIVKMLGKIASQLVHSENESCLL